MDRGCPEYGIPEKSRRGTTTLNSIEAQSNEDDVAPH